MGQQTIQNSSQGSSGKGGPAVGAPGQSGSQPGQGANPPGTPSGGKGQPSQLMQPTPPGQAQNTVTSGQPIMGQPNQYSNTVGANTQPLFNNQAYQPTQGKGKG
jgi:hypothetical protein